VADGRVRQHMHPVLRHLQNTAHAHDGVSRLQLQLSSHAQSGARAPGVQRHVAPHLHAPIVPCTRDAAGVYTFARLPAHQS
jgi:hypothetical protein